MPRKPKPVQQQLPEIEVCEIPEVLRMARRYCEKRDERMATLEDEVALKNKLLDVMHEHKVKIFRHEDVVIEIIPGEEKLKVRAAKEKGDEE